MFEPTEYVKKQLFAGTNQPRNFGAGTVYGSDLKAGAVVASRGVATADAKAKKSVTFTGTPVESKTVKVAINGTEVTYTTASTTLNTEVAAIATAIGSNATLAAIVSATSSSGKLLIEWKEKGIEGNAMEIVVTLGDGTGLTAGDVTVETIGQLVGDELIEIVDSDSATAALQKPIGVLCEDGSVGKTVSVAYTGEFNVDELKFADGDSINTFKKALREIGCFTRKVIE